LLLIRSTVLQLIQQVIHPVNILKRLGIERMPFFVRLLQCKLLLPALQQVEIAAKDAILYTIEKLRLWNLSDRVEKGK
jgi:hypothetical protein